MTKSRQKQLTKNWLKAAQYDLEWAQGSFRLRQYAGVCFLSQQIVEKSLKAFLYSKGEELRKVHDLDMLLNLAIKHNKDFKKYAQATSTLTGYYLRTRYPDIGDIDIFNKKELAQEALKWAEEILNFLQGDALGKLS